MAHIHNAILRGYNSIYLQAAHIKEEDKSAFIGYALTWYKFVKSHHDDEEAELFPKVAEVLHTTDAELWDATHKEHGSFLQGLSEYEKYLSHLTSPSAFRTPLPLRNRPHRLLRRAPLCTSDRHPG